MTPDTFEASAVTPPPLSEDRTLAIVSYLTLIGFIVALVLYGQPGKKTALNGFHLRQNLGLLILSFVVFFSLSILALIPIIGLLTLVLYPLCFIGFFVFWIIGLLAAVNGELKPLPVIGVKIQEVFKGAFI